MKTRIGQTATEADANASCMDVGNVEEEKAKQEVQTFNIATPVNSPEKPKAEAEINAAEAQKGQKVNPDITCWTCSWKVHPSLMCPLREKGKGKGKGLLSLPYPKGAWMTPKGKGKGQSDWSFDKSKGKGKGTPKGGFQGPCHRCGEWGHYARECNNSQVAMMEDPNWSDWWSPNAYSVTLMLADQPFTGYNHSTNALEISTSSSLHRTNSNQSSVPTMPKTGHRHSFNNAKYFDPRVVGGSGTDNGER